MVTSSSWPQPESAPRLSRGFFQRQTVAVARDLLGTLLCRRGPGGAVLAGRIVETEAYHGPNDRASHAHRGMTARTAPMYGLAGLAYVYQIYGVWFCLNVVTGAEGYPAAVLIRALELPACDHRTCAGPGKLCAAMGIDKRLNTCDLVDGDELWLATHEAVSGRQIARGPRIGVDYAGAWAQRPWRFWIKGHPAVSRLPRRHA